MNVAITVASYAQPNFVRLNLAQLNAIWPDASILVAEDRSAKTEEIDLIAGELASFVTSNHRRGACAGWVQAVVSGLSFAQQEGADILLMLNQRLVPVLPAFRDYVEGPFSDKAINIVVPGRAVAGKIALPNSKYFSGLGILTDVLVFRVGSISPAEFLKSYTDNYKFGGFSISLLPEPFIGQLLASHFKNSVYVSSSLGDSKVSNPAFLRREQSKPEDYQKLANFEGNFDCRDWMEIEPGTYRCRPELTT